MAVRLAWTKQTERAICAAYQRGRSIVNVGLEFKMSKCTIRKILINNAVTRRSCGRPISTKYPAEIVDVVVDMWRRGLSSQDIHNAMNLPIGTIMRFVAKSKIRPNRRCVICKRPRVGSRYCRLCARQASWKSKLMSNRIRKGVPPERWIAVIPDDLGEP